MSLRTLFGWTGDFVVRCQRSGACALLIEATFEARQLRGGTCRMHHGVAVGAQGHKVVDGVDCMHAFTGRQFRHVVNMDETLIQLALPFLEIEVTDLALAPVVLDARGASVWIAL